MKTKLLPVRSGCLGIVTLIILMNLFLFSGSVYGKSQDKATVLLGEGWTLYEQGNFSGAIPKWEEGLGLVKASGDVKNKVKFLSSLGLAYRKVKNFQKAILSFEEVVKIRREIGDESGTGDDISRLAGVYRDLDEYQKAITNYEEAIKIEKKLGNKKGLGVDLTNIGLAYFQLNEYQKSISFLNEALKIHEELKNRNGMAVTLLNLGNSYGDLGEYRKAISVYEEGLKIKRELNDKAGTELFLNNLGIEYSDLGKYQKSITYYEQALAISKEIGQKDGIGINLMNLGIVYDYLGDYPKAIAFYEQSLAISRETGNKKEIATNLNNLGVVFLALGDYPKAISYFEQSFKINKESGFRKPMGMNLSNLGSVFNDLGDYPKAISYYEQVIKIYKEIGVPTAKEEAGLADVYLNQGEIEKAEKEYTRLKDPVRLGQLSLVKKNYGQAIEYFNKELKRFLDNRQSQFLFAEYCGLGKAYSGLKDFKKAEEYFEKAVSLTETERESLSEAEKSRFFVSNIQRVSRTEPYEGMMGALTALNQQTDAFYYSENLKARTLSEAIAKGQSSLASSLPPDFSKTEQDFIANIRGLRKEMETLYRNKAMDNYSEKEKELKRVKSEQDKFVSKLRSQYPEYASVNYPNPIKPAEVRLNPGEVLIEFEVTDEASLLFLLKDKKVQVREIPISRKDLQDLVLTYRNYFEGIGSSNDLLNFKADSGKKLYTLLFGDMLNNLPAGTSLIIVPDEFLGVLPFEALITEMADKEQVGEGKYGPFPIGVKYLGDKFNIVYAQSGTSLSMLRSLKKGTTVEGTALAVCDPIFSKNDKRMAAAPVSKADAQVAETASAIREWKTMGVAGLKEKGAKPGETAGEEEIFPRLEKTEEIATGVKSLFGEKATVLVGDKAREEDVVKLPFQNFRYITFGTHGILDNAIPWVQEPALVLNQVGNSEGYDGFLTMSEVMGLKMGAEVVALTACETGVGKNVRGEGVMGMGRAFQYAGAGNVLMSLWSVAEDATVALSNSFFRNLKEGKDSKEALRLARAEIRKAGYEHPFYWSAFILVGR